MWFCTGLSPEGLQPPARLQPKPHVDPPALLYALEDLLPYNSLQDFRGPTDYDPYPFPFSPQSLLLLFSLLMILLGSNARNCSRYTMQVRSDQEASKWWQSGLGSLQARPAVRESVGLLSRGCTLRAAWRVPGPLAALKHKLRDKNQQVQKPLPSCKELSLAIEVFIKVIANYY